MTKEGSITFNFVFEDEKESSRILIEDENAIQEPATNDEEYYEELAKLFLDIIKSGATVKDLIESFLNNPSVLSGEYKNGRFYFQTTDGPFDFWFPFLKSRSEVERE